MIIRLTTLVVISSQLLLATDVTLIQEETLLDQSIKALFILSGLIFLWKIVFSNYLKFEKDGYSLEVNNNKEMKTPIIKEEIKNSRRETLVPKEKISHNEYHKELKEEHQKIKELEEKHKAIDAQKIIDIERNKLKEKQEKLQRELSFKEDTVIIDGLMYQNIDFESAGRMNWKEANKYAENLRFGGYDDWRLPTKDELRKLGNIELYGEYNNNWSKWFEKNKSKRLKNSKGDYHFIRKEFLEKMPKESWFWSTEKDITQAWVVLFSYGW